MVNDAAAGRPTQQGDAAFEGSAERRLMALVEASGALLASPDSADVLRTLLDIAKRLIEADAYAVWRERDGEWTIAAMEGLSEQYGRTILEARGRFPESLFTVEDVSASPLLANRAGAYAAEGIRSMLTAPLRIHGEISGTVVFYFRARHVFTDSEQRVATALANLAAAALGAADLHARQKAAREAAEAAGKRARFLAEAGALLSSSLDYETTLARVAALAVPDFADWASVDILDETGAVQRVVTFHRDPAMIHFANDFRRRFPMRDTDMGMVAIRTGRSVLLPDISDEALVAAARTPEHLAAIRALGLKSVIAAPLIARGRSLGVLSFVSAESGRRYTAADLALAEELASRAATAVDHARLYESVRLNEERYRSLVSAASAIVWTVDPEGAFVEPQPSWEAYTGQAWEQYRGKGWLDAVHPDDRDALLETWERFRLVAAPYYGQGRLWHAASGEYRHFSSRAVPVRKPDGSIREWVGTIADVHEKRQAEQERAALLAREREARATAELLNRVGPALAAELDLQRLTQLITDFARELSGAEFGAFFHNLVNDKGESYTLYTLSGVPHERFAGFPLPRNTALFAPTFRGEGAVRCDDVSADPRYGRSEPHFGMPPGHLPVRSYLAVPVVSRSGEVLGGLFFGHSEPGVFTEQSEKVVVGLAGQAAIALDNARLFDESQRAQAALRQSNDELRRANADLNQFAYSASHDLQEPLRMVALFSQLVLREYGDRLDERGREYLGYAAHGARRMELLVRDILAYTQAANIGDDEIIEPVDPGRALDRAVELLDGAAASAGAAIRAGHLPPVAVKQVHLVQLFHNLVGNAIKYRRDEPPRVEIDAVPDGGRWRFSVADNGIGIEPEYTAQVFGLFKRLHSASEYPGTGIGLAICQKIVERYHGRIWVESQPGSGSTFYFTLPGAPDAPR